MRFRIAIGGIHIESSTFTPYLSGDADFTIRRGAELLAFYPFLEQFDDKVEFVPLVNARALLGGVVGRQFYDTWHKEFFELLQGAIEQAPIDGILFDIHGAMSVEGSVDAEGELAEALRAFIGERPFIATTMDLHGNVSDKLFANSDLLTCYRTAPHIDVQETKLRALTNLVSCLEDKRPIVRAKVDIPILLSGEMTSTEVQPGRGLYRLIDDICQHAGVFDASIWMGFPWADQARCHAAVVVCGTDQPVVEQQAKQLAEKFWTLRDQFAFVGPTADSETAISEALQSTVKPFFISDTGDNPGAGGAGDMNLLLKAFVTQKIAKKVLFASLFDGETIQLLYRHQVGDALTIQLGGKVDRSFGGPLTVDITIERFFADEVAGKCALVSCANIYIIVTENRFQYGSKRAFQQAGVNSFADFDIIVVKMGYLEPDLSAAAKGWVMALTPGAVNQDIVNVTYQHLKQPLYPFDNNFDANLAVNCRIRTK